VFQELEDIRKRAQARRKQAPQDWEQRRPRKPDDATRSILKSILSARKDTLLQALTEMSGPFAICISLSKTFGIELFWPPACERLQQVDVSDFWIPHALTRELKEVHLTVCFQLLPKLRPYAHDNWRHLVTGDESWFYYEYVRDRIWTARDENATDALLEGLHKLIGEGSQFLDLPTPMLRSLRVTPFSTR
jgi:hypothetical protein